MLEKVDNMLETLVELAARECQSAKQYGHFSKSLVESCGIVISLAYGRWGKDDK